MFYPWACDEYFSFCDIINNTTPDHSLLNLIFSMFYPWACNNYFSLCNIINNTTLDHSLLNLIFSMFYPWACDKYFSLCNIITTSTLILGIYDDQMKGIINDVLLINIIGSVADITLKT